MPDTVKYKNNFRFLDWTVYKDSRTVYEDILKIAHALPKEYRFEIGSQMIRSALSISLNIAEGSGKHGDAELNRFMSIAMGSLYETIAAIDILRNGKQISEKQFQEVFIKLKNVAYQLGCFKKTLKTK